jgi:hypothetical protein
MSVITVTLARQRLPDITIKATVASRAPKRLTHGIGADNEQIPLLASEVNLIAISITQPTSSTILKKIRPSAFDRPADGGLNKLSG